MPQKSAHISELRQPVAGDPTVPHADAVLEMLGTDAALGTTCAVLTPAIKARLREVVTQNDATTYVVMYSKALRGESNA
jgi:hypothetical protein